jgi:prolipoprotein diacylglyceryltransferase
VSVDHVDNAMGWIGMGTIIGARLYSVAQNGALEYLKAPWTILAVGRAVSPSSAAGSAPLAGVLYSRRHRLSFLRLADAANVALLRKTRLRPYETIS